MALEEAIQEIKKEIIETHNLIIKTDNLVKNLTSEIRQIQKRQERYERKYIFNSVFAYVIFVIIIFAGLYVAFEAKVGVVHREKQALEEQVRKVKGEFEEVQHKLAVRAQQEKSIESFMRLKKENRPLDALKAVDNVDPNQLTSQLMRQVVVKEAEDLRAKIGEDALNSGKEYLAKGQLQKALSEIDRGLEFKPTPSVAAIMYLQRGNILVKLNRNAQSAEAYLSAANADPKGVGVDSMLSMAATALETSGDVPRALSVYERIINEYGNSSYAAQARRKVAKLTGQPEPAAPATKPLAAGQAAPPPAPGPAPAAPTKPLAAGQAAPPAPTPKPNR